LTGTAPSWIWGTSVVTSKPAIEGHFKTGQTDVSPGQDSYTPPTGISAMIFSMMRNLPGRAGPILVYTDRDRSGG
jgi:hypothetical protein